MCAIVIAIGCPGAVSTWPCAGIAASSFECSTDTVTRGAEPIVIDWSNILTGVLWSFAIFEGLRESGWGWIDAVNAVILLKRGLNVMDNLSSAGVASLALGGNKIGNSYTHNDADDSNDDQKFD